jgi:hypothetical protein
MKFSKLPIKFRYISLILLSLFLHGQVAAQDLPEKAPATSSNIIESEKTTTDLQKSNAGKIIFLNHPVAVGPLTSHDFSSIYN